MPKMDPITRARMRTTPVIKTDRKIRMPVFVLILSRRICRLIFSSMQYRLPFLAVIIFLLMILLLIKKYVLPLQAKSRTTFLKETLVKLTGA